MLPIPIVGTEPGPQYATDINSCLTIIDGHNHSPGLGVQVPTAGLNINADLSFGANNAYNLRSVRFSAQGSPLALADDLGCLYESGVDLYYNDGLGNQIRITQSGGIAGTPGSIANLTPPASASYVSLSSTFVWQSAANTPANMDAASYIFRNLVANSKGLTLEPPAAMGADYTITLPTLPVSQKFLTLDATGNMAASWAVDGSTIVISSNTVLVPTGGITATQLATDSVTTIKIQDGAVTADKLAAGVGTLTRVNFNTAGAHAWTSPAGVSSVIVSGRGGSGGGGGGSKSAVLADGRGGGGGGGAATFTTSIAVTPSTLYSITIGAGGTGGPGTNVNGNGTAGTDGGDSTFDTLLTFKGAKGGGGGINAGAVGAGGFGIMSDGGQGGTSVAISLPGRDSPYASGGTNSGSNLDGSGGGGGAGDGVGGDAGTGNPGQAGDPGVDGGGGGGGGCQISAGFSGAGGNGTDGSITISYVVGSP